VLGVSASRPPALVHALRERDDEARTARVGAHDPADVDDHDLGRLRELLDAARERLARAEPELALQLHDDGARRRGPQRRAVSRGALALRGALGRRVDGAQRRSGTLARTHEMHGQILRELTADGDAAHRVALLVQPRREDRDAEPAGKHREHSARDAALGRQSHRDEPFAGEVVHAARRHHAEDVAHDLLADSSLAGQRVDAAVRERRGHHGEVAAVDGDGALAEVEIERGVGVVQHAEAAEDVRHAAVAVPGLALGAVDGLVEREGAARVAGVRREQELERVGAAPATRPAQAIAPALMSGLRGMPVTGEMLISLNASPLGSTPMRLRTSAVPRRSSASA
jgi:hypothetical protein